MTERSGAAPRNVPVNVLISGHGAAAASEASEAKPYL